MGKTHNAIPLPIQGAAEPATGPNCGFLDIAEEKLEVVLFEMAHSGEWFPKIKRVSKCSVHKHRRSHTKAPSQVQTDGQRGLLQNLLPLHNHSAFLLHKPVSFSLRLERVNPWEHIASRRRPVFSWDLAP
jgi:hypothetical protein